MLRRCGSCFLVRLLHSRYAHTFRKKLRNLRFSIFPPHTSVARISWADAWGRVGVEDQHSFREQEFAVVGEDYQAGKPRRSANPAEQSQLGGGYPSMVLLGCPPCRSRPMPIAVITSPGSGIE